MLQKKNVDMLRLREALEASWDDQTVYEGVMQEGNPAFGQCYPTSWVVQFFFPDTEIIKGTVWTGTSEEVHFWNGLTVGGTLYHIDMSWQQFPHGSTVREYEFLDRTNLKDGVEGKRRCNLLKDRVVAYLES
jgi:hypothetical protein